MVEARFYLCGFYTQFAIALTNSTEKKNHKWSLALVVKGQFTMGNLKKLALASLTNKSISDK